MRAWLFQATVHKRRHGDKAPWSVGYYDPRGKKRSRTIGAKSMAEKYARRIEGQLASGTYEDVKRATWQEFVNEYESKVLAGLGASNRQGTMTALNNFARLAKPGRMASINTATVDGFIAARRSENVRGGKPPSPATVNCDLRYLRAVLRKAMKWGFISTVPDFAFLREPGKLPTYVTPEHFAAIYSATDAATLPDGQPFTPSDYWRALLVVAYMTGWRVGQIMALRWSDVDLERATAFSRAADNKGKRDVLLPLHPLVVDHLRRIKSFSPLVFPWALGKKDMYREFYAIQAAAGAKPDHGKAFYGFHDLRRAFATMNAENLTADALQLLMQHRSYTTTQRYINMARQTAKAVDVLYVPDLGRAAATR